MATDPYKANEKPMWNIIGSRHAKLNNCHSADGAHRLAPTADRPVIPDQLYHIQYYVDLIAFVLY